MIGLDVFSLSRRTSRTRGAGVTDGSVIVAVGADGSGLVVPCSPRPLKRDLKRPPPVVP
jgi:hypothetical protein